MPEVTSLTVFASALKKRAAKAYVTQFNKSNFFMENIKRKLAKESASGREFLVPMLVNPNASFGSNLEHEDLPTPGASQWAEVAIPKKYHASRMMLSHQAMKASRGNASSWVEARVLEEREMVSNFSQKVNEQWYGWGLGAIARVNGSPTLLTFVVDDDQATGGGNTFGLLYIQQEMWLNASATTTTYVMERNFHAKVDSTTASTYTVTIAGDTNDLADGDYIFREGSKNREMVGLMGAVDDGTLLATYLSLDRTAAGNSWWKARITNVNGSITENRLITEAHELEKAIGATPNMSVCTHGVLRSIADLFTGDRRFMISGTTAGKIGYKGGWSGLKMTLGGTQDMTFFPDRKCPASMLFMLNLQDFSIFQMGDPGWLDEGTGVLKQIPNKRDFEATYYWDAEIACLKPQGNARLYGITES